MTPAQQKLVSRLGITNEELAIAAQTCSVEAYVRSRVEAHGSMNGAWRHPSGKGVTTYQDAVNEAWPKHAKVRK